MKTREQLLKQADKLLAEYAKLQKEIKQWNYRKNSDGTVTFYRFNNHYNHRLEERTITAEEFNVYKLRKAGSTHVLQMFYSRRSKKDASI